MEITKLTSLEMQSINGGRDEEKEEVDEDRKLCQATCSCYRGSNTLHNAARYYYVMMRDWGE